MALTELPSALPSHTISTLLSITALYVAGWIISALYNVYYGPLSKYPGSKLWALSPIPRGISMARGRESADITQMHKTYGPIIRIGPNELSYAAGAEAWKDIYGHKKHGHAQPFKLEKFYGKPLNGVVCRLYPLNQDEGF